MGPTLIPEILGDLARTDPTAPAITCAGTTISRGDLDRRSNRLARAFIERGLGAGDIAAIALPNSIATYEACVAVWKVGAMPLPISWRLPRAERDQIIELAQPKLVIGVDEAQTDAASWDAAAVPDPRLDDGPLPAQPATPWKVQHSGGSTGRPKLVVAGATTLFDVDWACNTFGIPRNGVQVVLGPLYHTAAFSQSMFGLFAGQHLVVLPQFDARVALEAIDQHQANFVICVPTMMSRMAKLIDLEPSRYSLASLQRVWHTGAPCPPWLKRRWIELVGADTLYEVYGGTEQQAFAVISGTDWLEHEGSVGQVVFGDMKVVDDTGSELPRGATGEIYLRTPADRPKTYRYIGAEARTLPDRWETLGEMGHIDEEGYVFLADRRDDMVLVGGSNIYPAEVEGALTEHPDVISCAVVGLPDEDLGNRLHAVVQTINALEPGVLAAFLRERVEPHKIPRSYRFVETSLRDDAGKVRRTAVRAQEILLLDEPSRAVD